MLDLFRTELENHSLALEKGLVNSEVCEKHAEALVRAAHSLRGAARIVKLDVAAKLAQAMEEVLTTVQKGSRRLSDIEAGHLREANDLFRQLARCAPSEIPANLEARRGDIEEMTKRLAAPAAVLTEPRAPVEPVPGPAPAVAVEPFLLDCSAPNSKTTPGFSKKAWWKQKPATIPR